MFHWKKISPFLSILLAIYFGAFSASSVFLHKCEHVKENSLLIKHGTLIQSHGFSEEENHGSHDHLYDIKCGICDELEDKRKVIKKNNVNLAYIIYVHDLNTSASKTFVKSINFGLAPPLRGPPLA